MKRRLALLWRRCWRRGREGQGDAGRGGRRRTRASFFVVFFLFFPLRAHAPTELRNLSRVSHTKKTGFSYVVLVCSSATSALSPRNKDWECVLFGKTLSK